MLSFRIKWWKVLELNCGDAWTAVQIYLMSLKCTLNAQMIVFIWCICYHRENNNLEKYHCLIYPWITPCWCCALLLLSPLTSGLKYSNDIPTSLNLNSNECYRVSLAISSPGNVIFSIYYLSISLTCQCQPHIGITDPSKGKSNFSLLKLEIQGQMAWYRWQSHRLGRWSNLYSEVEGVWGDLDPLHQTIDKS